MIGQIGRHLFPYPNQHNVGLKGTPITHTDHDTDPRFVRSRAQITRATENPVHHTKYEYHSRGILFYAYVHKDPADHVVCVRRIFGLCVHVCTRGGMSIPHLGERQEARQGAAVALGPETAGLLVDVSPDALEHAAGVARLLVNRHL